MSFYLPKRVPSYLLRLSHNYETGSGNGQIKSVLDSARVFVIEGVDSDNYNGGMDGHGVVLFIPLEVLGTISPTDQKRMTDKLLSDLRSITGNSPGEYLSFVNFELNDENDETFKRSSPISKKPAIVPDNLTIWKPDLIRVFLSHRDQHKAKARELADALEPYGFSCFVAHDTITPMAEWRQEIMKGLQTMDVLVVFLTDDFHDSIWTNQEVGYGLGDAKPIISVKLGVKDPPGFISHVQALKGSIDEPVRTAERLAPLLADATGSKERIQTALVRSFTESSDWTEAKIRFERMIEIVKQLTEKELQMIISAFSRNDQLHGAAYLTNQHSRLKKFLIKTTGKSLQVIGTQIKEEAEKDDFPF